MVDWHEKFVEFPKWVAERDAPCYRESWYEVLAKYLTDEASAGNLSQALKVVFNSVYGLTPTPLDNPFCDLRGKGNYETS